MTQTLLFRKTGAGKALIALLFVLAAGISSCSSDAAVDKLLSTTAEELNKKCPMMVDQMTRWDNTVAMPGKVLQYNYTVVGMDKSQLDAAMINSHIKPMLVNNVKTNPEMKALRDKKVTFGYSYNDKNGVFISKFTITPEEYKE